MLCGRNSARAIAGALVAVLVVLASGADVEGRRVRPHHTHKPKPSRTVGPTVIPTATADVNVLDFGADPTGVADSTTDFADALATVPNGGWLYVPNGTYSVQQIVLGSNKGIRGQTKAGVTLKRRANASLDVDNAFIESHSTSNAKIKDLTLQGTRLLSGTGDDILIGLINALNFTAQNLDLKDADGIGIQTEGLTQMTGCLFEDITITDTVKRVNSAHGVGLWPYKGTHHCTFRRITVTRTESSGVMLDAGTTGDENATSVDNNTFEDIAIVAASSIDILGGLVMTGAADNTFDGLTISDTVENCPIAFGDDQSGIGNFRNLFSNLDIEPLGGNLAVLSAHAEDNDFNIGTGSGVFIFTGATVLRNNVTNWTGATGSWQNGAPSGGGDANTVN